MQWIDYLILIAAILLIVSVSLQKSDDNIQDAFSGEKSELYKNRKSMGFEAFLTKSSTIFSIVFVGIIIIALIIRGY